MGSCGASPTFLKIDHLFHGAFTPNAILRNLSVAANSLIKQLIPFTIEGFCELGQCGNLSNGQSYRQNSIEVLAVLENGEYAYIR